MTEKNWNVYPEGWMREGHHCMISHIKGLEDKGWAVECSEINPHPLYGDPGMKTEYDLGYRYYVLKYNVYDGRRNAAFYKDPDEAQEAFEDARDPLRTVR